MPLDTVAVAKQVLVWLDAHAPRADRRLRRRPQLLVVARPRRSARAGADAADGHRDPQLAAREERVPRHEPAAGRRELDLPAAHGGARAREDRPHQRAAAVEPAGRADVRLRVLGHRARAAALRAAHRGPRSRELRLLARPSVPGAGDHHRHVGRRRIAADGLGRHHAGQMALRLLRPVSRSPTPMPSAKCSRRSGAASSAPSASGGKAWAAASRSSRRS